MTLVSEGVEGSLVSVDRPLSAHGPWLQVWVDPQHIDNIMADIEATLAKKNVSYYHPSIIIIYYYRSSLPFSQGTVHA